VLLLAAGIGEAEVDELDFALLHHGHHVGNGLGHQSISQWACGGLLSFAIPAGRSPKNAHENLAESMPVPTRGKRRPSARRRTALAQLGRH
jgi:hypothetical protein